MSDFIRLPNLPEKDVGAVIIGRHEDIIKRLNSSGIETVVLEDNPDVEPPIRNHADISAFHLGGRRIILDKRQTAAGDKLKRSGFDIRYTEKEIKGGYPNDVRLNCAVIGNRLICGKKGVEPFVSALLLEKLKVNQGYCRCSVCILNERAFITDDESIYKRTKDIFDVLLIEKGDILLDGKPYGFIGGASAKLSKNEVTFFGSLSCHRNANEIKAFIRKHNMGYAELFDGRLRDIGSVVLISEK